MIRIKLFIAGVATCLVSGCADPSAALLRDAHRAVVLLHQDLRSAEFDDAYTQVFPEKGLVCGSRIKMASGSEDDVGYQRYYFSQASGAALEGETQFWLPLANACIAAIAERVELADRRLMAAETST